MPLFFEKYNFFLNLKCASLVDASCYSLQVLSTVSVDKNRGSSVPMRADSASQNFLSERCHYFLKNIYFFNLKCASLVDASCYSLQVLSTISVDKNRGSSVHMRADSASQNFLSERCHYFLKNIYIF
jgi:hypothetical protein